MSPLSNGRWVNASELPATQERLNTRVDYRPYDGDYLSNVHVMGKYSPLDFETEEPINPLDGLLRKTK